MSDSPISAGGSASCCSEPVTANTLPLPVSNAAGLSAVRYRIGTFTSFRRAMLDKIAAPDLMTSAVTTLSQAAAATATTIVVLDASAFPPAAPFRIKIGAEYLTVTAGAGRTTWTVQRGASPVSYTAGTPVWLDPVNPFAAWHEGADGDYQTAFVELWAYLADVLTFYQERIANEAFLGTATQRDSLLRIVGLIDYRPSPGAGATGVVAFTVAKGQSVTVPAGFRVGSRAQPGRPAAVFETTSSTVVTGDNSSLPLSPVSPLVTFAPNQVVLQGVNTQLAVNDFLLAVENLGDLQNEVRILLRITDIQADKTARTTTVSWLDVGEQHQQVSKSVALFSFKVVTAAFGARAPGSRLVPTAGSPPGVTLETAPWDSPGNRAYYLPAEEDDPTQLFLDGGFEQLKYSPENPGWAVLLADDVEGVVARVVHVIDARQMGKVAYSVSAKVTRLTVLEDLSASKFPVRTTTILTGSQRLTLQSALPLPDEVTGTTVVLSGVHPQLQDGQTVVLRGPLAAPNAGAVTTVFAAEPAVLKGVPTMDTDNDVTTVTLKDALVRRYLRSGSVLMANVVEITQGETVKDEVLGSGDGSAFQSYSLKQKPLTYLPAGGSDGLAAVSSTLSVAVNGVGWTEVPTLVAGAPHDQVFATALDDSSQTTVIFGDGVNGARPSTGANNIHARYRKGLGAAGNLPADAVQRLVDNVPNLQKVTNPLPSSGGEDAAGPSAIRSQAPASLRTFSRAVSAADYAALALSYPGIAKASAAWVFRDPITSVALATPYVQLTLATSDGLPLKGAPLAARLREFLNAHRDPNVVVRIQDYTPVYVRVAVDVAIDARFPHQATLDRVMAALNPGVNADGSAGFFAFERMQFGQAVYLSALYAAVQAVPGVLSATVTVLQRLGPGLADATSPAPGDILVGPTELIGVDAAANPDSQLVITGLGGFADS